MGGTRSLTLRAIKVNEEHQVALLLVELEMVVVADVVQWDGRGLDLVKRFFRFEESPYLHNRKNWWLEPIARY